MTNEELGFLMLHNMINWLYEVELRSDDAVDNFLKRVDKDSLSPNVILYVKQLVKEVRENGIS